MKARPSIRTIREEDRGVVPSREEVYRDDEVLESVLHSVAFPFRFLTHSPSGDVLARGSCMKPTWN